MTGWVTVAGLGPGADTLVTPEVSAALAEATDIVGYIPYVARVAARPGLRLHASDNRVEVERILVENGQTRGVVANGREIACETVLGKRMPSALPERC